MAGQLAIYALDDQILASLRKSCREEGVELIDMRTPWRRLLRGARNMGWFLLVCYVIIAHYAPFKSAISVIGACQ